MATPVEIKSHKGKAEGKAHYRQTIEAKNQLSKLKQKIINPKLTTIPEVSESRITDLSKSWNLGRFEVRDGWNFGSERKPTSVDKDNQLKTLSTSVEIKSHKEKAHNRQTMEAKNQHSKLKQKIINPKLSPIPEVPESRISDLSKSWHLGRFGVCEGWNFGNEIKPTSVDKETKRILRSLLRQPPSKTVFTSETDVFRSKTEDNMHKFDMINKTFDTMILDQQIKRRKQREEKDKNDEKKTSEHRKQYPVRKEMATITEDIKHKEEMVKLQPFSLYSLKNKHRKVKSPVETEPHRGSIQVRAADDKKIVKIKQPPVNQELAYNPEQLKNQKLNKAKLIGKSGGDILHIKHRKTKDPKEPKIILILKTPFDKLPKKPITKSTERVTCPMCEEEKRTEKLKGKNSAHGDDTARNEKTNKKETEKEGKKKLPAKKEPPKEDPQIKELRKSKTFSRLKLSSFASPTLVQMRDIGTSTPSRFYPYEPIKKLKSLDPKTAGPETKSSKELKDYVYSDNTYASIARIKKNAHTNLTKIIRRAEKAVGTDYADFRSQGSRLVFKDKKDGSSQQEFTFQISEFPDITSTCKLKSTTKTQLGHKNYKKTSPSGPTIKISRKRNSRQKTASLCVQC